MELDYDAVLEALKEGSAEQLDVLARHAGGFPNGVDPFLGRRWIINAIDVGSTPAIEWMLRHGVDLDFRDEEGRTPLHAALDRQGPDRYRVLELLLSAGAPVNRKGVNDWTPAHMAAVLEDVEALRILVRHGADLTIRTAIDHYATPLEEARELGKLDAVRYLESVGLSGRRAGRPEPAGPDE